MAQIGEAAIGTLNFAPGTEFSVFDSHATQVTPDNSKNLPMRIHVSATGTYFATSAGASGSVTLEVRRVRSGANRTIYLRTKSWSGNGTREETFTVQCLDFGAQNGDQFKLFLSWSFLDPGNPGGTGFSSTQIITETIKR